MSAWVLPDDVADCLPTAARHIEELRRQLLDAANSFGYELVIPPLLEYLESLLSGTGEALDLQTFKLVDQLTGRSLGLRADTTPQVARIDAHLLGRRGVTRLCYAGAVVHTRPAKPYATREPLQFGAEIYGHTGLEADLEIMELALHSLQAVGLRGLQLDLADIRVVDALLQAVQSVHPISAESMHALHKALSNKDRSALAQLVADFPTQYAKALLDLTQLYGGVEVLGEAQKTLPASALLQQALADLQRTVDNTKALFGDSVRISVDLADLQGYAYYTGMRFAIYADGAADSVARGGRYDEVGAAFGRKRPAAGFSLDIKALQELLPEAGRKAAIRAPWSEAAGLRAAVRALRERGETVVCLMPGHESEVEEFDCDRELVEAAGQWVVKALG